MIFGIWCGRALGLVDFKSKAEMTSFINLIGKLLFELKQNLKPNSASILATSKHGLNDEIETLCKHFRLEVRTNGIFLGC